MTYHVEHNATVDEFVWRSLLRTHQTMGRNWGRTRIKIFWTKKEVRGQEWEKEMKDWENFFIDENEETSTKEGAKKKRKRIKRVRAN